MRRLDLPSVVVVGSAALLATRCIDIGDPRFAFIAEESDGGRGGGAAEPGGGGDESVGGGETGTGGTSGTSGTRGTTGGSNTVGGSGATSGDAGGGGSSSSGTSGSGTSGLGGSGAGGTGGTGASGGGGEGGSGGVGKPQCPGTGTPTPRIVFTEDFESYAPGLPYELEDFPWIQAESGRDVGVYANSWAHGGAQAFMLSSYTTRSEIAYARLDLAGPPRSIVIELWFAALGEYVFQDFAEFGLGVARSKFNLVPSVALEVNDHTLELRANPEHPVASTNGHGGAPAAIKPASQELFNEFVYVPCSPSSRQPPSCPPSHSYLRIEFDLCTDAVKAFVGDDAGAPLVGTGSFDGSRSIDALYLAGGLNPTYVDDVVVKVGD